MKRYSLEEVYKTHMKDLYKYLLSLCRHPQTAEDLVQITFIKAYEHLELYNGEKVRPWLFRVAYNSYIDWYRKEKRLVQTDPQLMAACNKQVTPSPESDYIVKEKITTWLQAVQQLPEKSKQVILLRDYYDFTYQDIAQILELSLTNVKVTLFRARQKIKEVMLNEML